MIEALIRVLIQNQNMNRCFAFNVKPDTCRCGGFRLIPDLESNKWAYHNDSGL